MITQYTDGYIKRFGGPTHGSILTFDILVDLSVKVHQFGFWSEAKICRYTLFVNYLCGIVAKMKNI